MNRQDLRVVKTRQGIREALIRLLSEKDFHLITVQDILNLALINRKTFYSHYSDKYALADELCGEYLVKLSHVLEVRTNLSAENLPLFMMDVDRIYRELYAERREILALWHVKTERINFAAHVREMSRQLLLKRAQGKTVTEFQFLLADTVFTTMLQFILQSDIRYSAQDVLSEAKGLYELLKG